MHIAPFRIDVFRWSVAFLLLTGPFGRTGAQTIHDEASYEAWKSGLVPSGTQVGPGLPHRSHRPAPILRAGGGSGTCDCWVQPDASYTTINNNTEWDANGFQNADDGSYGPINLPFSFWLYGSYWSQIWINTNGNITVGAPYITFTANGFPYNGVSMVAPFWADVDLRGGGPGTNVVQYKVTPTALYVNWTNVGYFSMHTDKLNTFQLIITDGTDPIVPNGANVSFCYQDMQWTTGDANAGVNGFGGNAANVGANQGNGIDYLQFGRFDQPGISYDGPYGNPDGVDWLDGQHFTFSTDITTGNVPPVVAGQSICDTLVLCVGQTSDLSVTFLSPEPGQITVPAASCPTLSNFTIVSSTSGLNADIDVQVTPALADTGIHYVIFQGTDNGLPVLTSTVNIVLLVQPSDVLPDSSFAVCSGDAPIDLFTLLAGSPSAGGDWTDPNGDPSSGTFVPGTSIDGPYEYTAAAPGFCTQVGHVWMTTYMVNDQSVVMDASCNGIEDGTITINTIGNGGPWDYSWTGPGGGVVQTTSASNGDVLTGAAGTYTVIVAEGLNGNACMDTLMATIQEPPPVIISLLTNDTTICKTGEAVMDASASGGTGSVTEYWSNGLPNMGPQTVSPNTTTTYTVFALDDNACSSDTLDLTITVLPSLQFMLDDTLISCPEVANTLAPTNVSGGDGQYAYDWGGGASSQPDLTVALTASQDLCLTLTDGCETPPVTHCIHMDIIPIPPLVLTVDSTLGCEPFAVQFTLQDTTGGAQVQWDFGDGVTTPGPPIVGHTYADPGGYDVGAVVTWPNGCQDDTLVQDMVSVIALPQAEFAWDPDPANILWTTLDFHELSGSNAMTFDWDFAGLGGSTDPDPTFLFPNNYGATYPVTLLVTNELGCPDSVTHQVEIADQLLVYVPNSFTPDGDGVNDAFSVIGNDIDTKDFDLMIFDRWGEMIFHTTDPTEPWTGARGGGDGPVVQDGVYPYRLRVRSAYSREKREYFGQVTLLK
ncbi:MAG: gliding motility-associated C-terminal domain-containing protein [Flavobacteriales bacterium]|nr:gliding motility-associated C-terminal domain-containing protein [Flavobacteriales bacterium]MCB9194385.1 gliding motility-associated C-terminal domain-containing protein [Flavobacteriales bacterium]